MASLCPCGCGCRVGFSVKGAAVGVVRMDAMLAVVLPEVDVLLAGAGLSDEDADRLRGFVDDGRRTRQWFVDYVHKEARPGRTPDLLNLKRMMDHWGKTALALAQWLPAANAKPTQVEHERQESIRRPKSQPLRSPVQPSSRASSAPSLARHVPNSQDRVVDPFEHLSLAGGEALSSATAQLVDLRPVLATAEGETREAVLGKANRFPFHLRHPSRALDVGIQAGVEASLEDLRLDSNLVDPECDEWIRLAVQEGWRVGRRILGSDVAPYPYERHRWEPPADVVTSFSKSFALLAPGNLIEAMGRQFVG